MEQCISQVQLRKKDCKLLKLHCHAQEISLYILNFWVKISYSLFEQKKIFERAHV